MWLYYSFDFKKAFDLVPHVRLLTKLQAYGISGKLLEWIRAFLTDCMQRIVLNGTTFPWAGVLSGIPQRSVLGALLFLNQ